mmetsp:Transcript_13723/g.47397  ORF Transcript_13723/g.47397 Transcript_13723/m.47397 type:complete len:232 (+) Transcript_13723:994-1689(+)
MGVCAMMYLPASLDTSGGWPVALNIGSDTHHSTVTASSSAVITAKQRCSACPHSAYRLAPLACDTSVSREQLSPTTRESPVTLAVLTASAEAASSSGPRCPTYACAMIPSPNCDTLNTHSGATAASCEPASRAYGQLPTIAPGWQQQRPSRRQGAGTWGPPREGASHVEALLAQAHLVRLDEALARLLALERHALVACRLGLRARAADLLLGLALRGGGGGSCAGHGPRRE